MIADLNNNPIDVTQVNVIGPYMLSVAFSDGTQRKISLERDLRTRLNKGMFKDLLDAQYFAQAFYDAEGHTVAWPNGIDLSPESLYSDFDVVV